MSVRIANSKDPDQTASFDLGLRCLSYMQFRQTTSVWNFKTHTVLSFSRS